MSRSSRPGCSRARSKDDEGEAKAGSFVWRPAGNRHDAHSPNGCLVLSIFLKPNKFLDKNTVGWATKGGT